MISGESSEHEARTRRLRWQQEITLLTSSGPSQGTGPLYYTSGRPYLHHTWNITSLHGFTDQPDNTTSSSLVTTPEGVTSTTPVPQDYNTTLDNVPSLVNATMKGLDGVASEMQLGVSEACDGMLCLGFWYNYSNQTWPPPDVAGGDGWNQEKRWEVLLLLLIVVAGITGNLLVCLAITLEKKLQSVTNYFLMSLAVADLFVSLVVMPCAIASELIGYWPFGVVVCDIWQVCDVMMCTSSIMHMCTISLDRYNGIRNPLKTRNRSRTVVGIKIATVWLISLMIASPIILLSLLDSDNVLDPKTHQCAIFNRYFLVYGSLAAFFIPLLIMFVAYSLTINLLYRQARRCASKDKAIIRRSKSRRPMLTKKEQRKKVTNLTKITREAAPNGINITKKWHNHIDRGRAQPSETEPLHKISVSDLDAQNSPRGLMRTMRDTSMGSTTWETSSNASSEGPGPPKFQQLIKKHNTAIKVAGVLMARRDNLVQKKATSVKTEEKAVKVLGTMFAIFVICWTPFFSVNFAIGVCDACNIDPSIFKVFLWLGYLSSTLNPIIYTIFNKNFKRAFGRLLTCREWRNRCHTQPRTQGSSNSSGCSPKHKQYQVPTQLYLEGLHETIL